MLEGDIKVDVLFIYIYLSTLTEHISELKWGGGGEFASIVAVVGFKQMVFMPVLNAVINRMCLIF